MRRSREVPLTVLAALALSATGCDPDRQPRHCVDQYGHIAPDSTCESQSSHGYHYLYGGSSGGHVGDVVVGGSASPGGGDESGVSRGGFGHSGGGDGGGE